MEEQEEKKSTEKQIQLSSTTLYVLCALVALGLVVIVKILALFGVYSGVLSAIMFILACGLTVVGMLLSYLGNKKLNVEFWLNLAVLSIACIVVF